MPDIISQPISCPDTRLHVPTNRGYSEENFLAKTLSRVKIRPFGTKEASCELMGGSDVDCFGDINDRKSMKFYYFKLNGRGTSFRWDGEKQRKFAISSLEAGYQGMAAAEEAALYLNQLPEDVGIQHKDPIGIGVGNHSCIRICQKPAMHNGSKHNDSKRDNTEDVNISTHYDPADNVVGDLCPKSLPVIQVMPDLLDERS